MRNDHVRKARLVAALLTLAALVGVAHASRPELPGYHTESINTPAPVQDVALDATGTIWIATHDGLFRFDGSRQQRDSLIDTLPVDQRSLRRMLITRSGTMWLAAGRGAIDRPVSPEAPLRLSRLRRKPGLIAIEHGSMRTFSESDGLPSVWVWAFAEDDKGGIWVGTTSGVARFDGRRFVVPEETREPLRARTINGTSSLVAALAFDDEGRLWIGGDAGLFWWQAGRIEQAPTRGAVLSVSRLENGRMAVGFAEEVVFFAGKQIDQRVASIGVRAVVQGVGGAPWLIGDSPPAAVDGDRAVTLRHIDVRRAKFAFNGWDGSVWTADVGGPLLHVVPVRVWNVASLFDHPVESFSVLRARDESIWFSDPVGLTHLDGRQLRSYRPPDDLRIRYARGLAEAPDGAIWVAGKDDGILRWSPQAQRRFDTSVAHPDAIARSLIFDERGRLWVAFEPSLVVRYDSGKPDGRGHTYSPQDGLCPGQPLLEGLRKAGGIWYASAGGGFGYVDDGGAHCWTERDGFPSHDVLAVHEDADRTLWLATNNGGGIVVFEQGRFTRIPSDAGLPWGPISGIVDGGEGNLWFGSANGVFRASREELRHYRPGQRLDSIYVYTRLDGMLSEAVVSTRRPALTVDGDGRVWASTSRGVVVIAPPLPVRQVPAVGLTAVSIDGVDVRWRDASTFPADTHAVRFEFTSPVVDSPHRIRIEHRLTGHGGSWQRTSSRFVELRELRSGDYALEVRVSADLGQTGPVLGPLRFSVAAPWWARWQAWALVVASLALIGLAAAHAWKRHIDARSALVLRERSRIARDLHDNLAQGFAALHFQIEGLRGRLRAHGDDARSPLATSVEEMQELLTLFRGEARQAVWNLRADGASPRSLGDALRVVAERSALGARVALELPADGVDIADDHRADVAYIVQEAITNAVTHGEASTVTVSVVRQGQEVAIEVVDDGPGFSAEQTREGRFGLVGMRERAERMGGRLRFERAQPRGMRVVVEVPAR